MSAVQLYAMFILGVFGTGHCIGMCGPLIFAFPGRTGGVGAHLCYHTGRIVTYGIIGAGLGSLGTGISKAAALSGGDQLVWIARTQIAFSIIAAGFLLLFGLTRIGLVQEPRFMALADPQALSGFRRILRPLTEKRGHLAMLLTGLLFGLLPCGLSYAAFARVLPAGGALAGASGTVAFGIGTVPGLLLVGLGASGIALRYRRASDLISGVLMIAMAVSLAADAALAV
jgi:sulfite exporter TauE/SafE